MTHEEPRVAKVPTDDFAVPGGNPPLSSGPVGTVDDASEFVLGNTVASEPLSEPSVASASESSPTGTSRPTSPYKELDYFIEQDQSRFAGRERDIHEVLARIETSRAFVLYGRSGLGKTSLLLAGVFPELRDRSYRPVYVRTLEDPLDDLRRAIAQQCELPDANTDLRGLLLAAGSGGQTPVLVLDQFEEFFTRFKDRPRDRAAFVREVAAVIIDAAVDVRVLFSLREDFLAAVDDFQRRLPELFSNSYRLPPLSAFGAREAIVRPLIEDGVPYDERLVTRLVDELARFEFESARLQVTCAELYRSARAAQADELRLTEADLTRLEEQVARSQGTGPAPLAPSHSGTGPAATSPSLLTGIFRRYLDQAIEPVESKHPLLGRLILDALISRENTKLAVSQHDLRELDNPDDVDDALALLVERHLVRRETRGDGPWFELIHECLVDELRRWLDRNEEFSRFCAARNLIADGTRTRLWLRDPGLLLSYESLAKVIDPHRDRLRLNRDQTEFVLRSQIYRGTLQRDCWAERFGKPETTMLLRQLLDDPDTNVRRTAAWAVSSLSDPDDSLMARCLSLALNANEEAEVRNAAGFALALKGQPRHLDPLRKEIRRWRLPRHVKELLATLEEQGRLQGLASPWQQWRAQRRAVARVRKLYASQVEEHIWPAAVIGTLSGLLWALTSAVVIANFFEWVINPIPDVIWYQKAGVFLGAALLLGGVTGAFLGRSAIAGAVTVLQFCPRRPWQHVVQHSGVLFGLAFLSALLPVFLVLDRTAFTWSALWTLPAALATLLLFVFGLSWAAQVTRGCFGSQSSRASIAGWTVVTNLVVGVALPLMSGTLILRRVANWNSTFAWDLALIWFAFTLVSSLILFVMTLTLSIAETECQLGTIGPRTASPRRRGAFAVAATLLVPWFPWQFGIHSIPWLAPEHDISAGSTIAARVATWPDTHYFHLRASKGSYFRVELPRTLKNTLGLNEVWRAPDGNEETLMWLPTGRGSASIGANDYFNLTGEHRLSFSPLTQLRVTSDGITALGPLNMHAQLGRDPTLSGGRTLEISAPPGSAEPGAWVKLYLLNPSPQHRLQRPWNATQTPETDQYLSYRVVENDPSNRRSARGYIPLQFEGFAVRAVADGSWRISLELAPNFKSTSSSTEPLSTDPLELGVLVEPPSFDPRTP